MSQICNIFFIKYSLASAGKITINIFFSSNLFKILKDKYCGISISKKVAMALPLPIRIIILFIFISSSARITPMNDIRESEFTLCFKSKLVNNPPVILKYFSKTNFFSNSISKSSFIF